MASKLTCSFSDLGKANFENQKLNIRLTEFNSQLEAQVNEKTKKLKLAVTEAKSASKAKSEFLANMSHEIRTPLNGIIGLTTLLINEQKDNSENARQLSIIQSSANNLLLILNDILDYSKIEAGALKLDLRSVDVIALFNDIASVYQATKAHHSVDFIYKMSETLPQFLFLDSLRITQIANNLLNNASKFTEQGEISLTVGYENSNLLIIVTDTGIGMSKEQQSALFKEFTQADVSTTRKYGGTGLGLTICKRLIDKMNGVILIESEELIGSQFKVVIPAQLSEAIDNLNKENVLADLNGQQVLLVEDNPVNQLVANKMLAKFNCDVHTASDGEDALVKLKQHPYKLVFMDCQMPSLDGFECTKTIRLNHHVYGKPYIVAITANAFEEDKQKCLDSGMNGFVSKPDEINVLNSAIYKYLSNK